MSCFFQIVYLETKLRSISRQVAPVWQWKSTEESRTSATSQQWQPLSGETPLWVNGVFFLNVLFSCRDYLTDYVLWEKCTSPENIVPWHMILFSLLLVMSGIQAVLCGIQVVNGLFGTICGDCKRCGCCGVSSWRLLVILCTEESHTASSWHQNNPTALPPAHGHVSNILPKPYTVAIRK